MKFTNLFIIFFFSYIALSCKGQENMDLSKIRMPLEQKRIIEKAKLEATDFTLDHYIRYTAKYPKTISFNGVTFKENFSKKYHSPTTVGFYLDEENKSFPVVELNSYDNKGSKLLYDEILEIFGNPVYYIKKDYIFYGVWEKQRTTFLLELNYSTKIGEESTTSTTLRILDNSKNDLTDYYFSTGFGHYGDYFKFKNKTNNQNLTYKQFAIKRANDSNDTEDKYLKKIKENQPL